MGQGWRLCAEKSGSFMQCSEFRPVDSTPAASDFESVLPLLGRMWIPLPSFLTAALDDPSV